MAGPFFFVWCRGGECCGATRLQPGKDKELQLEVRYADIGWMDELASSGLFFLLSRRWPSVLLNTSWRLINCPPVPAAFWLLCQRPVSIRPLWF
jgi:hypothetical protein